MHKANLTHTPNRRTALTTLWGGAALVVAGRPPNLIPKLAKPTLPAPAPNPDATLLALAAAFMAEQPAIEAWTRDEAGDMALEAAGEAAQIRANAILDQLTALPAVTLGGIHAKARCALCALRSMCQDYPGPDVLAARSALVDLTREVVA